MGMGIRGLERPVTSDIGGTIITEHDQAMALAVGRAMDKSAELLRAAAEAGDSEAQFALALLNLLGRGVEQNAGEAFRLFGLASDAGDEQAASFRDLAAEQLARANRPAAIERRGRSRHEGGQAEATLS